MNDDNMITFDLSLNNKRLYTGCMIEEVAGKLNLQTPVEQAIAIVGKNCSAIINELIGTDDEMILTGAMAVWSYLIVFHLVVHRFRRIYYDDGKGNKVLVAAHG